MSKIAISLIEATRAGKTTWEDDEDGGYISQTERFTFLIRSVDGDDRAPYEFEITLRQGEVPFGSYTTHPKSANEILTSMRALYDTAKLNAHGLGDTLIDEVFKDLE